MPFDSLFSLTVIFICQCITGWESINKNSNRKLEFIEIKEDKSIKKKKTKTLDRA